MTRVKALLTCVVILASPSLSVAEIRQSFMLDHSAWHATDVVLATEGEKIDGRLSVVETWKGALSPGDALTVTGLHIFANEASRMVTRLGGAKHEKKPPVVVSGERMILFLRRSPRRTGKGQPPPGPATWYPASQFGGMKVSVVWVEGETTYAFTQVMNPGPSILNRQRNSQGEMKERVREIAAIQSSLTKIAGVPVPEKRAEKAAPYTKSNVYYARGEAFRILAACKTPAVPILRKMLADKSNANQYGPIVDAMADAGGSELGAEFTQILTEELKFWKAKAPSLQKGWWNGKGLDGAQVRKLRNRYFKTKHVLYGLRKMKFQGSRNAVQAFRNYWRSLPQLEDKSGIDQMSQACDAVLKTLGPPPRQRPDVTRAEWIEECLRSFEAVKPGLTRSQIEKIFPMDGGTQGVSPVRFVHPDCSYLKIDVDFDFKRDAKDQNRAIWGKDDKATKVSKPYIERPRID